MLNGKLVLLGLTGAGLNDMRTTAIGETVPGIEIQAQVIESLFDGRIIMRPQWLKWAESGALLFIGSLVIWYIPRPRSAFALYLRKVPQAGLWLTLGTNAVIAALGLQIFIKTAYLFDAASFFLVLGGVMGSLVSSSLAEMDIRKKATQLAQQEHALQEARLAGEREPRQALNTATASAP
jgi:CHASE2 domain-containing sensor protein